MCAHSPPTRPVIRVRRTWPALARYALAAVFVLTAIFLTRLIAPVRLRSPFLLLLLAVMVASRYGGWGPGVAATISSAALAWVFLMHDGGVHWVLDSYELLPLALFCAVGLAVTWINHLLQRSTERLGNAYEELERDVERRMTVEAELRRSEERFRVLFESASQAILVVTDDGVVEFANRRAGDLFGRDDLAGTRLAALVPNAVSEPGGGAPQPQPPGAPKEVAAHRADGSEFAAEIGISRTTIGSRGMTICFVTDVTARKQLQQKLHEASKMEAIGRLAGGVAHDFNNLLTGISGFSELVLDQLAPSDPLCEPVREISGAAARAAALTGQLLAFSRRQIVQKQIVDVNEVVAGVKRLIERLIGEDIKLTLAIEASPSQVYADPHQISQVLLNLAVNARDAMPSGGELLIRTRNASGTSRPGHEPAGPDAAEYVAITVADTGHGMSREVSDHIFEPFFTTKPAGKGTGLGLSTVHGIVHESGGWVSVESSPDRGARFDVVLPLTTTRVEGAAEEAVADPQGKGETLLLVEDDATVRSLARQELQKRGYAVLAAGDAVEAESIMAAHAREIAILVTDVVLPGVNGAELAKRLKAVSPGLPVLYMSGYTDSQLAAALLQEPIHFIHKPFTGRQLARAVRSAIENPAGQTSLPA